MNKKIHPKTVQGETVVCSRRGKNINLSNNPDTQLTEPLLLGNKTVEWIEELAGIVNELATTVSTMASLTTLPTGAANAATIAAKIAPLKLKTAQLKSDLVFIQENGKRG